MTVSFLLGQQPATTVSVLFAPEITKTKGRSYSRFAIIEKKMQKDKENMP